MDFYDIMLNLCIGIVGGIFSSVIVSRIFLINSNLTEQVARVQQHIEKSYGLAGIMEFYSIAVKKKEYPKDEDSVNRLNEALLQNIHLICDEEVRSFQSMIFDDLEKNLHDLAVELNDFVEKMLRLNEVNEELMLKYGAELVSIQNKFNAYRNISSKIFVEQLIKDKWLRMLAITFLIIIVLTVIA